VFRTEPVRPPFAGNRAERPCWPAF